MATETRRLVGYVPVYETTRTIPVTTYRPQEPSFCASCCAQTILGLTCGIFCCPGATTRLIGYPMNYCKEGLGNCYCHVLGSPDVYYNYDDKYCDYSCPEPKNLFDKVCPQSYSDAMSVTSTSSITTLVVLGVLHML